MEIKNNETGLINIKEWYTSRFATDEMGSKINSTITFNDIADTLNNRQNYHEAVGVANSLVRERIFEQLSKISGTKYEDVFSIWANGGFV